MKTALDGVVTVDDCHVHIGKRRHKLLGSKLLELNVLRVRLDVRDGCGDACTLLQSDDSLLRKQKKCSRLVGHVVGNRNDCTLGKIRKILGAPCVDAERLIVDCADGDQVAAVFLVELIQIRYMLEVVGVKASLDHAGVGGDGVFELYNLKRVALLLENGLDVLKDLCVRHDVCADLDGLAVGFLLVLAAGGERQGKDQRKYCE